MYTFFLNRKKEYMWVQYLHAGYYVQIRINMAQKEITVFSTSDLFYGYTSILGLIFYFFINSVNKLERFISFWWSSSKLISWEVLQKWYTLIEIYWYQKHNAEEGCIRTSCGFQFLFCTCSSGKIFYCLEVRV